MMRRKEAYSQSSSSSSGSDGVGVAAASIAEEVMIGAMLAVVEEAADATAVDKVVTVPMSIEDEDEDEVEELLAAPPETLVVRSPLST